MASPNANARSPDPRIFRLRGSRVRYAIVSATRKRGGSLSVKLGAPNSERVDAQSSPVWSSRFRLSARTVNPQAAATVSTGSAEDSSCCRAARPRATVSPTLAVVCRCSSNTTPTRPVSRPATRASCCGCQRLGGSCSSAARVARHSSCVAVSVRGCFANVPTRRRRFAWVTPRERPRELSLFSR